MFFSTNLRAARHSAVQATLVELVFAVIAAGLAGAVTQRLRHAVPVTRTALVVWLGMPCVMLSLQSAVHAGSGTPHMRTGLIASFLFAACASGFNWFSMQRGAFLTGQRSFFRDLAVVPKLIGQFITAPLRR